MISEVAASEPEEAQTVYVLQPGGVVYTGLRGLIGQFSGTVGKLKREPVPKCMERHTAAGESPVGETVLSFRIGNPSTRDTWNLRESVRTVSQG